MRISLVPRLLPGLGRSAHDESGDAILLDCLDQGEEINRAVVSGLIAAKPKRDTSRDGDPITVLLLSFAAPDERIQDGSTCCEIEVLDSIADRHRRRLTAGMRVAVVGQLTGAGGLWASHIVTARRRGAGAM